MNECVIIENCIILSDGRIVEIDEDEELKTKKEIRK